jgi:glucose dehydrogenase
MPPKDRQGFTGSQYVAIAAGGGAKPAPQYGDSIVAFALPTPTSPDR